MAVMARRPFFNSLVCISSRSSSVLGLMLEGSHEKSPGRPPFDAIDAQRTSMAAITSKI